MHKLLRYIRQNRIQIAVIIIFIIFVYSLIHAANDAYLEQGKEIIGDTTVEERLQTDGSITLTKKACEEIINIFLKNCTEGNYERAYTYLSEDCKNTKYQTLEDFEKNYCIEKSIKGKGYSISEVETRERYKYKIEFNNMLSSGKVNTQRTVGYYEIVVDNGHDIKINIVQ